MSKLYYLKDDHGWFRNMLIICGKPWVTKNLKEAEAAIYTEVELMSAKDYFERRRVRVFPVEVIRRPKTGPLGKTWKKNEKIENSIEESQQTS